MTDVVSLQGLSMVSTKEVQNYNLAVAANFIEFLAVFGVVGPDSRTDNNQNALEMVAAETALAGFRHKQKQRKPLVN